MKSAKIHEQIKNLHDPNRTVIVGIDGLGGAGKSTVSEELYRLLSEENYSATVLHIDDFIHPKAVRYNDSYPEWEPYSNQKEVLYPNALDVIKKLSKSYSLGIIANQPPNTAERLKNDGLSDYFGICLLSECVNLFKPDRRFFERAVSEAGCEPCECVMIGDRLDNDVSPAKSIGMKTVRIVQGLYSVQKSENGIFVDREISELTELLDVDF